MMTRKVSFRRQTVEIMESGEGGPVAITLPDFRDERGWFMESFNRDLFRACGLPMVWPQDNLSRTKAGTIRGVHIQSKNPQGKLMMCVHGTIEDLAVDLRPESRHFGTVYKQMLYASKPTLFYVPAGFGHGFLSLTDSIVHYKCTTLHDASSDGGINPMQLVWMKSPHSCLISAKDRALPSVLDYRRKHS